MLCTDITSILSIVYQIASVCLLLRFQSCHCLSACRREIALCAVSSMCCMSVQLLTCSRVQYRVNMSQTEVCPCICANHVPGEHKRRRSYQAKRARMWISMCARITAGCVNLRACAEAGYGFNKLLGKYIYYGLALPEVDIYSNAHDLPVHKAGMESTGTCLR